MCTLHAISMEAGSECNEGRRRLPSVYVYCGHCKRESIKGPVVLVQVPEEEEAAVSA